MLDAQRALFSVEQSMVEIRRANLSSNVALFAALGGAFKEEKEEVDKKNLKILKQ